MRLHLFIFRYWTVSVCPFGWSRERLWESCRYKTGDELKDAQQLKVMNFAPFCPFSFLKLLLFLNPCLSPLTYTIHFYVSLLWICLSPFNFLLTFSQLLFIKSVFFALLASQQAPPQGSVYMVSYCVIPCTHRHRAYMSLLGTLMHTSSGAYKVSLCLLHLP